MYPAGGFRWPAAAKETTTATAGEEESAGAKVAELAVSRSYLLSENWEMGIAYMVCIMCLWIMESLFVLFYDFELNAYLWFVLFRDCGKQVYLGE